MVRGPLCVFLAAASMLPLGSMALAQQAVGTAFTYQGELQQNGAPATGTFDLKFRLYDNSASGAQLGTELCANDVAVANGKFTISLDFGAQFAGQKRWLEIEVRSDFGTDCSDPSGYALLTPRQEITPTPNAVFATSAQSAATANTANTANYANTAGSAGTAATAGTAANATQLNGQSAAYYTNAANLSGTISNSTLPANVARLDANQTFTGTITASNFSGSGAGLTNLNGGNIAAGTITRSRVASDIESVLSQWTAQLGQAAGPLNPVGWGNNFNDRATPPAPPPGLHYTRVAACNAFSLGLLSDGTIVMFGYGATQPPALPPGITYTAVAGGGYHAIALRSDGEIAAWGPNFYGENAVPPLPPGRTYTAIAAGGTHSIALLSDGTVVTWGLQAPEVPVGLNNVTAVATGESHSLALLSDGTVVTWGLQAPEVPVGLNNVIAIAAGGYHSLALRSDGTVIAWGAGTTNTGNLFEWGQAIVPPGLANVTAVSAGTFHSLALRSDGTVVGWGHNFFGQTTPPALDPGVTYTAISAGRDHSLALRAQAAIPAKLASTLGISIGTGAPTPAANGLSVSGASTFSGMTVDSAAANDGTLENALRLGGVSSGAGLASKQTSGGNQNGLDFFAGGTQRLKIASNGKVGIGLADTGQPVSGKLVVLNNETDTQFGYSSAIRGRHDGLDTAEDSPFGLFGQQRGGSGAFPVGGAAVFGNSDVHAGVAGYTGSGGGDVNPFGVLGVAFNIVGDAVGVVGTSHGDRGSGVIGVATSPSEVDQPWGVAGQAVSATGVGVRAINTADHGNAYGLWASTASPDGYAGYFEGGKNYFQGNVGIGTTTPGYPLDVMSATPVIRVGDSLGTQGALYFGNPNHGVKRVYTPGNSGNDVGLYTTAADVYLSANGTSTSQFVLKNSGKVGIGTNAPTATLDIQSVFSTTTDALAIQAGEAPDPGQYSLGLRPYVVGGGNVGYAFRVKNGANVDVPMHVTQTGVGIGTNNPGTNKLHVVGTFTASTKNFTIDHPLDPANKLLAHSTIESDEYKNLYDGVATTDAEGFATITLPAWFEALNENFRYQITVIDESAPDIHFVRVASKIKDGLFVVKSTPGNLEISWQVTGTRKDAFVKAHPLQVEQDKQPDQKGKYLHAIEHGKPVELDASYAPPQVKPAPEAVLEPVRVPSSAAAAQAVPMPSAAMPAAPVQALAVPLMDDLVGPPAPPVVGRPASLPAKAFFRPQTAPSTGGDDAPVRAAPRPRPAAEKSVSAATTER